MPKFAANLSMLFTEVPFPQRFAAAQAAGFTAVEYLFPYDYPLAELKTWLTEAGLKQVLFNLPSGNWNAGDRGIGANPERVDEFRSGVDKAIEYALGLGVSQVNLLAGKTNERFSVEEHWTVLRENARYAAEKLEQYGLRLVIENVNHFDIPGFFLHRTEQVLRLIEELSLPNVYMQYDLYHAQREEGELAATLKRHITKIGHIQLADNPGRHQPGTGEIRYPFLLQLLDELVYPGYVGLEYVPAPDTLSSLAWLREYESQV